MVSLARTVIVVAFAACGGGGKPTPADPALKRTDGSDRAQLEKRIDTLEAELAQRAQVASEIVIVIEGTALTVQAAKSGDVRGIDDKTAVAASP